MFKHSIQWHIQTLMLLVEVATKYFGKKIDPGKTHVTGAPVHPTL